MKFTKMHGCGNDYIYINGFTDQVPAPDKPELVRAMSDRHTGIGSDGVIFINPSCQADFEMEMWNADGTRAEMCGNGIRCVAKYVYDYGMTEKTQLEIESFGQVKTLQLFVENSKVARVRVNMGAPILEPDQIPVDITKMGLMDEEVRKLEQERKEREFQALIDVPLTVDDYLYHISCVSMGNPHAVISVENPQNFPIEKVGPIIENHAAFPKRTNVEFIKVRDRWNIEMRVWERGTGETMACGTGACAVAVSCMIKDQVGEMVKVHLLGGDLEIEWDKKKNLVYLTGPATTVFEGEYPLNQLF